MSKTILLSQKMKTLTSLWSEKLHYEFVESAEDGHFMFAFDAVGLLRITTSHVETHSHKHNHMTKHTQTKTTNLS